VLPYGVLEVSHVSDVTSRNFEKKRMVKIFSEKATNHLLIESFENLLLMMVLS
jgi:hypothetical protein